MTELYSKLSACRCDADAAPILESVRAGPSARKLTETGIALMQNPDLKQRQIGESFLRTAVREMEDKSMTNTTHAKPGEGEEDINKLKENETPKSESGTGNSGSEQSSEFKQPYSGEGTDEPNSDIESMQTASGEDQMGKISEMMPGMAPPGLDPAVLQQMQPQMPQLPQMNTPQMLKQMQYTVQEALKPYAKVIGELRQGVQALDTQVREIQTNKGAMTLDVENVKVGSQRGMLGTVRETVIPGTDVTVPQRTFPGMKLQETRNHILEMDAQLSKN